jgi:hypothetical protein
MGVFSIITRKIRDFLPHISRIFSADWFSYSKTVCFVLLGMGFFGVNIWFKNNDKTAIEQQKIAILMQPYTPHVYQIFSKTLYNTGALDQAMYQLHLSQQVPVAMSFLQTNVLGVTTGQGTDGIDLSFYIDRWDQQYQFWKQMTLERPSYRDAFVQLAYAAYHIHHFDETSNAIATAISMDPNNTTLLAVRDLLK